MTSPVYVFVYGTLRAGETNDLSQAAALHHLPVPEKIGTASVPGTLYDFGGYPGWVHDPAGKGVLGEIYRIAPGLIPVLDEIEEVYPGEAGLFVRINMPLMCGGVAYDCIVYPVAASAIAGQPVIEGGDWVAYRLARAG